jgi:hypothetical protein
VLFVISADRRDHLLMVDVGQAGELSNRGSVTPELIGVHDHWDIIFTKEPGREGLRGLGIPVAQSFREQGRKLDTPFPEGLVTHLNAALVQQFLHVSVTQGKWWYSQMACWLILMGKRWR